jgi:hypothetical protein
MLGGASTSTGGAVWVAGAGAWQARVASVEAVQHLSPITGWREKPLVSLAAAVAQLPVKDVAEQAE